MDKEQKLNMIFNSLADGLNITATMLDKAETAYGALGDHIRKCNQEWDVSVYPQGSFQLGTVIKPLNDEEQYDVDLVVMVKTPKYDAESLRNEVMQILESHGRYEGKIENKKPCIRIQYADSSQFHMDIASAQDIENGEDTSINIARFDGDHNYFYEISNPKGYIDWFKETMQFEELRKSQRALYEQCQTEVEELELSKMRTPLQKAIQILKRHRDIFFSKKENSDDRPSSIIITTLCAMAYEDTYGTFEKENVYLTIVNMLRKFPSYIKSNAEGDYYLENPSNPKENFLKKWKENLNLVNAFNEWITQARRDIIDHLEEFVENRPQDLRKSLYESFGQRDVDIALENYGNQMMEYAQKGQLKYEKSGSELVLNEQAGIAYRSHTYFGGDDK